jgi:1-acyl-sn-glycerol-3-phosphate acyltransferase
VPVAIHGSERVRNWKRLKFPKVTVLYGEPFRYERVAEATRHQQQAVADDILEAIRGLYGQLDAEGREAAVARWRAERRAKRTVPATSTAGRPRSSG